MVHIRNLLVGLTAMGVIGFGLVWLVIHPLAIFILVVIFLFILIGLLAYVLGESIIELAERKSSDYKGEGK